MGPARIYPWRKMHRSHAPSIAPGTFFVAQSWVDCITNMAGFNLRQAQHNPDRGRHGGDVASDGVSAARGTGRNMRGSSRLAGRIYRGQEFRDDPLATG